VDPIEVCRNAIQILAAHPADGPARTSDSVVAELRRLVSDWLRATEPGARALEQLEQEPQSPQAQLAATTALATAASFDSALLGQLHHQLTAVHWLWAHDAAGSGALPVPQSGAPAQYPELGWSSEPQPGAAPLRRRGLMVTLVISGVLLLAAVTATAVLLMVKSSLTAMAVGTWSCNSYDSEYSYDDYGRNFTVVITNTTYSVRSVTGRTLQSGTWSLDSGTLTITPDRSSDDRYTVTGVPDSAGKSAVLSASGRYGGHSQLTASPSSDGRQLEVKVGSIRYTCLKT